MTRVDKPALLKQLFELGARYSGQLLAYDKIKGGLDGAGNTTTLTHYTQLLTASGLLVGIDKYANQEIRRRASVPKWNVLNTAFMSVNSGYSKTEAKNDRSYWGRIFESTIGAHLYNSCTHNCKIYYWRNHAYEVDFVITRGSKISVIEVKSGQDKAHTTGFDEFEKNFGKCRKIVVGAQGIPIIEFLSYPLEHWL
jgi:uncharacterized protein